MQLKEGGAIEVDEVVAVTMGPESAERALHKAVSLGADRSVHLTDEALAGSDVNGTGYALAKALAAEAARPGPARPAVRRRRVLHDRRRRGRPPADALADAGDQDRRRGRQAALRAPGRVRLRHGLVDFPAVISVGDAINEPRYPSLKAIMGAKKKPLATLSVGDAGIEADRVGFENARAHCGDFGSARQGGRDGSSRTRTPTRRSSRSSPGSMKGSPS